MSDVENSADEPLPSTDNSAPVEVETKADPVTWEVPLTSAKAKVAQAHKLLVEAIAEFRTLPEEAMAEFRQIPYVNEARKSLEQSFPL
jgi:hypothetical protein